MSLKVEFEYWDKAAQDPDVDIKYISDLPTDECYQAISDCFLVGSVLDIGCGVGRLSNILAKNNHSCHVVGIDISKKMLDLAQKNNPESRVVYRVSDGRTIPFADNYFRSAYSVLTFQHIPDDAKLGYIKEAVRVLEPGGIFRVQFVDGDYHADIHHQTSEENMVKWFEDSGFKIEQINRGKVHPQWTWITGVKI